MTQIKFGFSNEVDAALNTALKKILAEVNSPRIAAFDADGTLWDTDVGERFFQYQIDHCQLPNMPLDPWLHYETMKQKDTPAAYLWLAQISEGQRLADVRKWATASIEQSHVPVFSAQLNLIKHLRDLNFEIYIVTASVEWAVQPAARLLGLDETSVIGIKTKVSNGLVGRELHGPLTWRQGKVDGLLSATGGVKPVIAVGNTIGDQALIESSSGIRMAVCSSGSTGELAETESQLQTLAQQKGWLRHRF